MFRGKKRGDVRGHDVLALTNADDERRALPGRDDGPGFVRGDHHQGIVSLQFLQRLPRSFHEATAVQFRFDEVSYNFRIGLGLEFMAFTLQALLQRQEVFDDAVVYNDDRARAVPVGMGVVLVGFAVRGPAGVPQAE